MSEVNSRSVQRRRQLQGASPLPNPIVGRLTSRESNLRPPLMSHEERQRLINLPITFRLVPPKTHAGTLIVRELPENGRRHPHGHAQDEAAMANIAEYEEDLIAAWEE